MNGAARFFVAGPVVVLVALSVVAAGCGGDDEIVARLELEGGSMLPTIAHGTVLEVHTYGEAGPRRGDIVVFGDPAGEGTLTKRVIGLPGDTITIDPRQFRVLVNGTPLPEPYIPASRTRGGTTCSRTCGPWTVPAAGSEESIQACGSAACYFVMGDNRQRSDDSRQGWLVPRESIIGWIDL